jgi:hypothetical protein
MRAVGRYRLEDCLEVADPRSLRTLVLRAGYLNRTLPRDVAEFAQSQALIRDRVLIGSVLAQLKMERATAVSDSLSEAVCP